jgi:C-terminal processing protease CtpA/Prc
MRTIKITLLLTLLTSLAIAQAKSNLDFETVYGNGKPANWGIGSQGFITKLDSQTVKQGKYALMIAADKDIPEGGFGSAEYQIPAQYVGKTILLRGYLMTENVSAMGYASLWLRLDAGRKMGIGFADGSAQKIIGTTDWTSYSLELPITDAVDKISVGGLLYSQTGKMWIDDLQVFIDGVPIDKATKKTKLLAEAKRDTSLKYGSNVNFTAVSPKEIDNLALLGRIWGFLKYHHPTVMAGKLNWDFELFRVLPKVMATQNGNDRDQVLLTWINNLGEIPLCKKCEEPKGVIKQKPDHDWMNDPKLSKDLAEKLRFVYQNRGQGSNYYGSLSSLGGGDFGNEDAYKHLDSLDTGYRLLALFRYWNIIQYYFPYKYLITEDNWNTVLTDFIPECVGAKNKASFFRTIRKLAVKVHDSHASAGTENWANNVPAVTQFIDNQLVVVKHANDSIAKISPLKIGDVVIKVGKARIDSFVEVLRPVTSGSNETTVRRNMTYQILRGPLGLVKLTVKRDGQTMEIEVNRIKQYLFTAYTSANIPKATDNKIADDIGYINIEKIKKKDVANVFNDIKNTRGLVIDIRNYPTDFAIHTIADYLLKSQTPFCRMARGDAGNPGYYILDEPLKSGGKGEYTGKVAILVNEDSQSSSEFHAMCFRAAPRAKVFGSQTAGADGDVSPFVLPGNIKTAISGVGVYYPDGSETQRIGIVPDVEVKPTVAGMKAGKDEVLEKAMAWIRSEKD